MPELRLNLRKSKRHAERASYRGVCGPGEFEAQTSGALLIPSLGLQKLTLSFWPDP